MVMRDVTRIFIIHTKAEIVLSVVIFILFFYLNVVMHIFSRMMSLP